MARGIKIGVILTLAILAASLALWAPWFWFQGRPIWSTDHRPPNSPDHPLQSSEEAADKQRTESPLGINIPHVGLMRRPLVLTRAL